MSRNPEIQARERGLAAQAEEFPQATALPDPMLSDTFWPIPQNSPQTASGRMPNSLMLSQQFPWFGKLRLRGQVADRRTQIALTELAETQLKVIEAVKQTYYDIFFHERALVITQENEKLLLQYIKTAESLYANNKVSQQDVLRAQVELSKLKDQLVQLRQLLKTSQADLARLLSISPESDVRASGTPELPAVPAQLDLLYQAAVMFRPELQGRWQAILRDRELAELAKLEYYPDVTLGVGWDAMTVSGALSPVADGKDNLGFIVAVNVPIWFDKLSAGVRQARNRVGESARLYDAARDDTLRLVKRYAVQAHALEQQIALYRKEIIPRAEQTLRVSTTDYRTGKVVILQLLDNWTQLLRFQVQLVRLETMLGQVLASLERVVGAELAALVNGENQSRRVPNGGQAVQAVSPTSPSPLVHHRPSAPGSILEMPALRVSTPRDDAAR